MHIVQVNMVFAVGYKETKFASRQEKQHVYSMIVSNLLSVHFTCLQTTIGVGGGGGLAFERGGNSRRQTQGCKFRILVSLRVF